jgi:hypothetical protein
MAQGWKIIFQARQCLKILLVKISADILFSPLFMQLATGAVCVQRLAERD